MSETLPVKAKKSDLLLDIETVAKAEANVESTIQSLANMRRCCANVEDADACDRVLAQLIAFRDVVIVHERRLLHIGLDA
jgi:hypothetical protein